jgi:hypothetical protein
VLLDIRSWLNSQAKEILVQLIAIIQGTMEGRKKQRRKEKAEEIRINVKRKS